jgi:phage terminase large subunit
LISKAVRGRTQFHKTQSSIVFPNGSKILLGGFQDERDIDKYIGIEYDLIIVEELNQLTFEKYEKLRGSLRSSKPNWRPRIYTSFNPGGVGHEFVKARYVIPHRNNKEKETRFVPSTYKENVALNTEYTDYLEGLQGDLGKAWREGEWDLFAGQYFTQFSYNKHVVEPFTIPERWPRFISIDPSGRSGTTSCHWYTVDSDGTVYVYREHFATDMDGDEHAEAIARKSKDEDGVEEPYRYGVIDSAAFAKAGYSETMVEIYQRHGVGVNYQLIPAAKERVVGWNVMHQYLRVDAPSHNNPNPQPKLKIFKTCPNLIREIPMAQHDEHKPEDVADMKKGAEHMDALDDCRYFLRTLREFKLEKEENAVQKRIRLLNMDRGY